MMYRIFPVLWTEGQESKMVYAIDRSAPDIRSICSRREKEDPAYYWDAPIFQRLVMPDSLAMGNSVTWERLPAWLSYVQTLQYTVQTSLSSLAPYGDVYISN